MSFCRYPKIRKSNGNKLQRKSCGKNGRQPRRGGVIVRSTTPKTLFAPTNSVQFTVTWRPGFSEIDSPVPTTDFDSPRQAHDSGPGTTLDDLSRPFFSVAIPFGKLRPPPVKSTWRVESFRSSQARTSCRLQEASKSLQEATLQIALGCVLQTLPNLNSPCRSPCRQRSWPKPQSRIHVSRSVPSLEEGVPRRDATLTPASTRPDQQHGSLEGSLKVKLKCIHSIGKKQHGKA